MKIPLSHLYIEQEDGTGEQVLKYSPVYANGAVLSLELPYDASEAVLRTPIDNVNAGLTLAEPGRTELGSVRGSFHIKPTASGVEIEMFDVVMRQAYDAPDAERFEHGLISGEVERSCFFLRAEANAAVKGNTGLPAMAQTRDIDWSSAFCSPYK